MRYKFAGFGPIHARIGPSVCLAEGGGALGECSPVSIASSTSAAWERMAQPTTVIGRRWSRKRASAATAHDRPRDGEPWRDVETGPNCVAEPHRFAADLRRVRRVGELD
jgi:hypothetical protein